MKLDVFTLLTVFPQMNMNTLNMSLEMVHLSKQLQDKYLQPIITQYFIDNKSEIWLLFLIAHSKR